MTPEFILQLLAIGGVGIGVYSAIKSDLAILHERTAHQQRQIDELKRSNHENHL